MESIFLYSPIVEGAAAEVASQVKAAGDNDIHVHINTMGGSAHESFTIYNLLKAIPNKVTTHNDGMAASGGSIVMMAGDERHHSEASQTLIHNSRGGTMSGMTAEEMKHAIPHFEAIDDMGARIYSAGTGIKLDTIKTLMNQEQTFTAKQAKKMGFATHITGRLKAVALFNPNEMNVKDKIYQLGSTLGLLSPELQTELNVNQEAAQKLADAAKAEAEKAVEKKEEGSEGADLLLSSHISRAEFKEHEAKVLPMLTAIIEYINGQPTVEEIDARIKENTKLENTALLARLNSSITVPASTKFKEQSEEEYTEQEQKRADWGQGIKDANKIVADMKKDTLTAPQNKEQ